MLAGEVLPCSRLLRQVGRTHCVSEGVPIINEFQKSLHIRVGLRPRNDVVLLHMQDSVVVR